MQGSIKIGRLAGIRLGIHWSFILLFVWVFLVSFSNGHFDPRLAMLNGLLVGSVFLCVLLHELGHSLAARRFNIGTKEITLLPFGGLAQLERMPEKPRQEFIVAFAGPLVNLAISGSIFLGLMLTRHVYLDGTATFSSDRALDLITGNEHGKNIWEILFFLNLYLMAFNLLPALPMDGGRMLRSVLAVKLPRLKATHISARVGQAFAIGFITYGIIKGQYFLAIVGFFVLNGAEAELQQAKVKQVLTQIQVKDVMLTQVKRFSVWDTVNDCFDEMKRTGVHEYIVEKDGAPAGIVFQRLILKCIANGKEDDLLCKVMIKDLPFLTEEDTISHAMSVMQETRIPVLPVQKEGAVIGLLSLDKVIEFVEMRKYMEAVKKGKQPGNSSYPGNG